MATITAPLALDETGLEINKALKRINNAVEGIDHDEVYGFIEHMDILAPNKRIEWTDSNKDYRIPLTTIITQADIPSSYSYGDWSGFPVLTENKPWMVRPDGTPDYRLNEFDYTEKLDGTRSDVDSYNSYDGGAFSWLPKIYKYERVEGSRRIVKFSFKKLPGFYPNGFVDENKKERTGVWLPIYYGTILNGKALSMRYGYPDEGSGRFADQYAAIQAFHPNAKFLGGPIIETILDLLIMFSKTTDLQEVFGYGNISGRNDSEEHKGLDYNGGCLYGQFSGHIGFGQDKILHSYVLGGYEQLIKDPYEVIVNGRLKVSRDYTYDPTGALYYDTGIDTLIDAISGYESYPSLYKAVEGYGAIPLVNSFQGSTSTGTCDKVVSSRASAYSGQTNICGRFGGIQSTSSTAREYGPRHRQWAMRDQDSANFLWGFGLMLLGPEENTVNNI